MCPGSWSKQKSAGMASSLIGRATGSKAPTSRAAGVLPVVRALVLIAHHRQVARQIVELLGVGVVMLAGMQGNGHAGEAPEVARPQARRAHHELARDVPGRGRNARHPALGAANSGDRNVLQALHAAPARALHVGVDDVDGARHSVDLEPRAAEQIVGAHERMKVADLLGGDHFHAAETEHIVRIGHTLELREAVPAVGDGHAPDLPESRRLPGLRFQLGKEIAGVGAELRVGVARPGGADQARRVPARARRELLALQQHDVRPSPFREVVGDARPGDSAADDHCARSFRYCLAHSSSPTCRPDWTQR